MAASRTAPTNEIGAGASVGTLTWGNFTDDTERVPELKWPRSVKEFDRMRNDSQVSMLYKGTTLPIRRYNWMIDPNGAGAEVVDRISEDLGLPVQGSDLEVDDTATNFSHEDHLRHALLALAYGHLYGEIVGAYDDEGWWRLRKIAPRMPLTLSSIEVEKDGMLKGIRQNVTLTPGRQAPLIPAEHLVGFVWEREGANWAGRSAFRSMYMNWLVKQRLVRVDATKHERNGMGVPMARATVESVGRKALNVAAKMASKIRAGQNAGGALPYGMDMKLMGVEGSVPDTLASIKYHDEAMARDMLMMFAMLGQTESGSRALGNTFVDFFALGLEAVAWWYARTMTNVLLKRWVRWNVGEGSPVPKLVFDPGPRELAVADMKMLIDAGAIVVDDELRSYFRGKHGLPKEMEETSELSTEPAPVEAATAVGTRVYGRATRDGKRRIYASDAGTIPLPNRTLRREPKEFEVLAAVDFATMDEDYEDAVARLVEGWQPVREAHITQLVDQIAAIDADDMEALAAIAAESGGGADDIAAILHEVGEKGAEGAVAEAKAQGVTDAAVPDLDEVKENLTARAQAIDVLLTRAISEAGARKATKLAGGALGPDDIANEVGDHLRSLTNTFLEEEFGGAVTQAQNDGRRSVLNQEEPSSIHASELLDKNTCSPCAQIDATEYKTMREAEADYPTGGYIECEGGGKCRGTLVGVYE